MALSRHYAAASRPLSVHEITEEAQRFEYSSDRPLLSWLRSAKMLLSEAAACETEGNTQMAYLYVYRHAELVLSRLSHHPQAKDPKYRDAINQARKQVNNNFTKLELWKPRINRDYDRYVLMSQRRAAERNQIEQNRRADQQLRRASTNSDDLSYQEGRRSLDADEHQQLAVEIARQELDRRDYLKRAAGQDKSESLYRDMRDVGRLAQRASSTEHASRNNTPSTAYSYPQVPAKEAEIDWRVSQPRHVPPPFRPPKELSSDQLPGPARPDKTEIDAKQYKFKAKAFTEAGAPLRTVVLPSELRRTFLNVAHSNTSRNLETCGVLCATTISNALFINHLVIPDQNSTSDTCDATEEGDIALFDYCDKENLLVCGWIHTHPSQTCFLSSRDLHTSSGYQQMLPEAIAIVCAPRHMPDFGIFRLTDPPGLPAVLKCTLPGLFHPHAETNLYTDANARGAGHVIEGPELAFKVVDLRNK